MADNRHMKPSRVAPPVAFAAGLILGLALPLALAGGKDDHERARAAVEAGQALPLSTLLERLQRTHPGQVMELELEQEQGRWIYEIKLLQPDGQLIELELDAGSAQVLKVKRKGQRKDESTKAQAR